MVLPPGWHYQVYPPGYHVPPPALTPTQLAELRQAEQAAVPSIERQFQNQGIVVRNPSLPPLQPGGPVSFGSTAGGGGTGSGGGGSATQGAGGSGALPASSGLLGVLSQMFPFITDFGNALPAQSGSVLPTGTALEDIAQVFGQIGALLGQTLRGVELLFTPTFWLRVILFLLALPMLAYGAHHLARGQSGAGVAAGIAVTGVAAIFLFGAFHNIPTSVNSPGTFAQWLHDSFTGQATLTAAAVPVNSLMEPPLTAPGAAPATAGP